MKLPNLENHLAHYTLCITRGRDSTEGFPTFEGYLEPSFGASSGESYEVKGNSILDVINQIDFQIDLKNL